MDRLTAQGSAVGLTLTLALVLAMPGQASAAPVKLPQPCAAVIAAGDGEPNRFCRQLKLFLEVARPRYIANYSLQQRLLIARVIGAVARRSTGVVAPAAVRAQLALGLSLRGIKNFCADALKAVKTVVGGAAKFIPQARLANCALQGSLAAGGAFILGADLLEVLVATGSACIGVNLPTFGKKP